MQHTHCVFSAAASSYSRSSSYVRALKKYPLKRCSFFPHSDTFQTQKTSREKTTTTTTRIVDPKLNTKKLRTLISTFESYANMHDHVFHLFLIFLVSSCNIHACFYCIEFLSNYIVLINKCEYSKTRLKCDYAAGNYGNHAYP